MALVGWVRWRMREARDMVFGDSLASVLLWEKQCWVPFSFSFWSISSSSVETRLSPGFEGSEKPLEQQFPPRVTLP